jgi:integrase
MAGRRIQPTYRFHRKTGKAIVTYYTSNGQRRSTLLPGLFNSDESRNEYKRISAILKANGEPQPQQEKRSEPSLTIDELIIQFMTTRVLPYYRDAAGQPTGEHENIRYAMKPISRLFGDLAAAEFKPLHLVEVQQAMIIGSWFNDEEKSEHAKGKKPTRLSRTTVNSRIGKIKLMFKWAAGLQLIPAAVHHGILSVSSLARGRSAARETEEVQPVPTGIIEQTMPHLPPTVRDIVELLLLTGMRVGEAVIMRAIDIDRTGPVWLYRPIRHKNLWRGKQRLITVGPKGQAIIRRHLKAKTDAFLFSPREQQTVIDAAKRANRKSKVTPSQVCRKKANPKRRKGELFSADDINTAIRRACERGKIPVWHTHQLRHTAALEISRHHGLEGARAALGQSTVQMAARYAGIDLDKAKEVASKIG